MIADIFIFLLLGYYLEGNHPDPSNVSQSTSPRSMADPALGLKLMSHNSKKCQAYDEFDLKAIYFIKPKLPRTKTLFPSMPRFQNVHFGEFFELGYDVALDLSNNFHEFSEITRTLYLFPTEFFKFYCERFTGYSFSSDLREKVCSMANKMQYWDFEDDDEEFPDLFIALDALDNSHLVQNTKCIGQKPEKFDRVFFDNLSKEMVDYSWAEYRRNYRSSSFGDEIRRIDAREFQLFLHSRLYNRVYISQNCD